MPKAGFRSGQSLIEVLVATAVGAIMIIGAITIIGPALRGGTDAQRVQAASAMGKALLENLRVWAEADWKNVSGLATSSANRYFLDASNSPFRTVTGTESVVNDSFSGLIGLWKLDESATSTTFDYSANQNHGTSSGGVAATSSCRLAGCWDFDGTDDYISIPHHSSLNVTSSLTMAAWLKPRTPFRDFLSKTSYNLMRVILNEGGTNNVKVVYRIGDADVTTLSADNVIQSDVWVHVAWRYDGSQTQIFINGSPSGPPVNASGSLLTNSSPLWIGHWGGGADQRYYKGLIDDVRIYDRALSDSEIRSLWNGESFIRYFYFEPVNRDSSGYITAGAGTPDPSTLRATVVYGRQDGATSTIQTYLTRYRNRTFRTTDWTGGPTQEGPATSTGNKFASSSDNLNYVSTTGSIFLNFQ